jgi:hypothetical protein
MQDDDMSEIKPKPSSDDTEPVLRRIKFRRGVRESLHWLEACVAFGAIAIVIIGAVFLVRLVCDVTAPENMQDFFLLFEELLSALLLLIVGVELALMLILKRPENLLEIMFFVIARKVLIKTEHVYDLLIAVAAIAVLFAVRKYLMMDDRKIPTQLKQPNPDKTKN